MSMEREKGVGKMLRKVLYLVILLSVLMGFAPYMDKPLEAGGPEQVIWAKDFEINLYGWPEEVGAGEEITITVSAGSESMGPASQEDVRLQLSDGGAIMDLSDTIMDMSGNITATLVYTKAGNADLTVMVGIDEVLTHTVKIGDNLSSIAEKHGDRYPEIWERNQHAIGNNPNRLVEGQVLDIVRYAPSRNFEFEVVAAEPAKVEFVEPLGVIAGKLPQVAGMLQDQFGNPTSGAITVTLQSEVVSVNVPDNGQFAISFTTVYTESLHVSGTCLDLKVEDANGNELAHKDYCVASAGPTNLEVTCPEDWTVGVPGDPLCGITLTDRFDNPVSDVIGKMSAFGRVITSTTSVDGRASFATDVPTKTQVAELQFEVANLSETRAMTVTPAAASEISATVQENGSIAVYGFDAYGNARIGDPVTVTVQAEGGITTTVEAVTVAPPTEEAEEEAAAVAVAPAAPKAGEEYVVQAGDTVWDILAASLGRAPTTEEVNALLSGNGLERNDAGIVIIHAGDVLTLPAAPMAP